VLCGRVDDLLNGKPRRGTSLKSAFTIAVASVSPIHWRRSALGWTSTMSLVPALDVRRRHSRGRSLSSSSRVSISTRPYAGAPRLPKASTSSAPPPTSGRRPLSDRVLAAVQHSDQARAAVDQRRVD
jgi:hypothetical protein